MTQLKAPVYREQGTEPLKAELEQLRKTCESLVEMIPAEVNDRLQAALTTVEEAAKATLKVSRGGNGPAIGYGLDYSKKALACDTAIAILRNIKQAKGW